MHKWKENTTHNKTHKHKANKQKLTNIIITKYTNRNQKQQQTTYSKQETSKYNKTNKQLSKHHQQ